MNQSLLLIDNRDHSFSQTLSASYILVVGYIGFGYQLLDVGDLMGKLDTPHRPTRLKKVLAEIQMKPALSAVFPWRPMQMQAVGEFLVVYGKCARSQVVQVSSSEDMMNRHKLCASTNAGYNMFCVASGVVYGLNKEQSIIAKPFE